MLHVFRQSLACRGRKLLGKREGVWLVVCLETDKVVERGDKDGGKR